MIQHRAARFVLNKPWHRFSQQHSITDILNYLQWPSLKSRRRNARLILLFKIVSNLLVLPNHCLPQPTPVSYTRANNPLKCAQLQSRIDLYKYSFLPRTIVTVSGKTGLIAHLKVSRNVGFKYSVCCSWPMVVATHTKFSHVSQQFLTFLIIH